MGPGREARCAPARRAFCLGCLLSYVRLMPRYFFDTEDSDHSTRAKEEVELEGIDAVGREAIAALADMARTIIPNHRNRGTVIVKVRDESGKVVLQAALGLIVEREL